MMLRKVNRGSGTTSGDGTKQNGSFCCVVKGLMKKAVVQPFPNAGI